jgi:two-component system chemotaxis sensor kinase CheA
VEGAIDEILREFLAEAESMVGQFGSALAGMPEEGYRDQLEIAYRAVHTVRGASRFQALEDLEALTTSGELLLARLRDGMLEPTPERMDLLGRLHHELVTRLASLQSGRPSPPLEAELLKDLEDQSSA